MLASDVAKLQARIADVTQQLRLERGRLAYLEKFDATSSLQPVATTAGSTTAAASPKATAASSAPKLPIEITAPLVKARDDLKATRSATEALEKQKSAAAAKLEQAKASLQAVQQRNEAAKAATSWDSPNARHYRSPLDRRSAIALLQRELADVRDEEAQINAENARLGADLNAITVTLLEADDLDWEAFKLKNEVKIQEGQLQSVKDEIKSIERIFAKKTEMLEKTLRTNIHETVLALEADKVVEQTKLAKHQAASRTSATAVRHRALNVMRREEKLVFYGDAIRVVLNVEDDEENDQENAGGSRGVPADDVDTIRLSIAETRNKEDELCRNLEFLDAQIANLEARVEILVRATTTLENAEEQEEHSHARRLQAVDRDFAAQRRAAERMVESQAASAAKKEEALRAARRQQSSRAQSLSP